MYKHLLIASDLTDASKPALDQGFALAKTFGAKVSVVHVTEPPFDPPRWYSSKEKNSGLGGADVEACRTAAQRILDDYVADHELDAEVLVVTGDPHDAVSAMAQNHDCDLIVVGTHGRRGWRKLMIGSVAESVVKHAPCPVLVVPTPPAD